MKKLITLSILILATQFALSDTQSISCNNFQGVSVDYSRFKPDLSRDGYDAMTITLSMYDSGRTEVTYTGSNQRRDTVELEAVNDDFVSWSKYFNDVHKIYTLYPDKALMVLTEIQTKLYNGNPQVRVYMGSCG